MSPESQEKFYTPEDGAQARFYERQAKRFQLWNSLIVESNLNEKNKNYFSEILATTFDSYQYGNLESYFNKIKEEMYQAVVHSYQTDEALALYKNIEADMDEFMKELYLEEATQV
jgi:hypothetical protein